MNDGENNHRLSDAVLKFFCPRGCRRSFKTNSAAYAHAVHCKFVAPADTPTQGAPTQDIPTQDTPATPAQDTPTQDTSETPELNPSEKVILDRLADVAVAQIEQGMGALQERVQANIVAGLEEAIPLLVAKEVGATADKIVEGLKNNPGGANVSSLSSMMGTVDQLNALLKTPVGEIIYKKIMGGGGTKGKVNIDDWRRGSSLAVRMLGANKSDPDATAEMIKEFTAPYKGKAGHDLYRGMFDTADMFKPAKKSETGPPKEETKPEGSKSQ